MTQLSALQTRMKIPVVGICRRGNRAVGQFSCIYIEEVYEDMAGGSAAVTQRVVTRNIRYET